MIYNSLRKYGDYSRLQKIDKLVAYFTEPEGAVKLTPKEREKADRFISMDNLIRKFGMRKHCIEAQQKAFEGLTMHQAAADYRDTQTILGSAYKIDTEYFKAVVVEWASHLRLLALQEEPKDLKALADAIKLMVKALGLDKPGTGLPDPSMIKPPVINVTINAGALGTEEMSEKELKKLTEYAQRPKRNVKQEAEDAKIVE